MNPTKLKEISNWSRSLTRLPTHTKQRSGRENDRLRMWDAAFDRSKQLEAETGVILPQSPTHRVAVDDLVGQKENHELPSIPCQDEEGGGLGHGSEGRPRVAYGNSTD